jgi:hypothetical protein
MPSYDTKLKVGRKLEGVDNDTASHNRVSALLRYDEEGNEDHVSLSIESDAMDPEDVFAVFDLLEERGILTAADCKTWFHQSKASKEDHGETETWQGVDIAEKVRMLSRGLSVRTGGGSGPDPRARNKQALLRLSEVEDRLDEVRRTLAGDEEPEDLEGDG